MIVNGSDQPNRVIESFSNWFDAGLAVSTAGARCCEGPLPDPIGPEPHCGLRYRDHVVGCSERQSGGEDQTILPV